MLNEPAFVKLVAELFASGIGRQTMIDELAELGYTVKDKDTITRWRRDPRVKTIVSRLIEDRAIQISRKVDSVIAGRLSQADDMPTEVLLKIRKEYGGSVVQRKEIADDAVTADAMKTMEENPSFAEDLERLIKGETAPAPEPVAVEA